MPTLKTDVQGSSERRRQQQRRRSNIEHSMSKAQVNGKGVIVRVLPLDLGPSMFDVGHSPLQLSLGPWAFNVQCWTFAVAFLPWTLGV